MCLMFVFLFCSCCGENLLLRYYVSVGFSLQEGQSLFFEGSDGLRAYLVVLEGVLFMMVLIMFLMCLLRRFTSNPFGFGNSE